MYSFQSFQTKLLLFQGIKKSSLCINELLLILVVKAIMEILIGFKRTERLRDFYQFLPPT